MKCGWNFIVPLNVSNLVHPLFHACTSYISEVHACKKRQNIIQNVYLIFKFCLEKQKNLKFKFVFKFEF